MKKLSILVTAVMVLVSAGVYADHYPSHVLSPLQKIDENKSESMEASAEATFSRREEIKNYKSITLSFTGANLSTDGCYEDSGTLVQYAGEEKCHAKMDIPLPAGSVIRRVELFQRHSNSYDHGSVDAVITNMSGSMRSYPYYGNSWTARYDEHTEVYSLEGEYTLLTNEVLSLIIDGDQHFTEDYYDWFQMYGVTVYYQ